MSVVLDASALLALIFEEKGAHYVLDHARGSHISTVNMVEIFAKCAARGISGKDVMQQTDRLEITLNAFSPQQAQIAADMLPHTQAFGLSLGDRACLALTQTLKLPVLTGDQVWANLDIGVEIVLIR